MQVFPNHTSNDYKTSTVLITADEFIYHHLQLQKGKKKNENIPVHTTWHLIVETKSACNH